MTRLLVLLFVVIGCRQMLDLEQARIELPPGSGGEGADPSRGEPSAPAPEAGSGGETVVGSGGSAPSEPGQGGVPSSAGGSTAPDLPGGAGGTDAATTGGSGPLPELSLCEQYCGALEQNCTGNLVQYSDTQTCLDTCALLPVGESGDTEVNSVHCRLAEAEKAGRLEPEFYCPLAGPASAGKCGTSCEAYCDIMMGFCTSESTSGLYFYLDQASCLSECALLPLVGAPYSAALHSIGPHFECRLFHACASNIDAEYHCGHAFGDPPCNEP